MMFWREEQRAVAELMYQGEPPRVIGYATFVGQYPDRFATWFDAFAADLTDPELRHGRRLAQLQQQCGELASVLDPDGLLRADWAALAGE